MAAEDVGPRVTIDSIRRAGATVFRHRGYRGATLNEIADLVGIHKASLYHYIESKEHLLLDILEQGLEPSFEALRRISQDGSLAPGEKLYSALHATALQACVEKESVAVYMQRLDDDIRDVDRRDKYLEGRRTYERLIRGIVGECLVEQGLPDDPKVVTFGLLGMANWAAQWFDPEGPSTADEIAHAFAALGLRALGYGEADLTAGYAGTRAREMEMPSISGRE
ncbi:MAG: TetR/AcrR family transcriptional regulator [Actinomycetota bacterium]